MPGYTGPLFTKDGGGNFTLAGGLVTTGASDVASGRDVKAARGLGAFGKAPPVAQPAAIAAPTASGALYVQAEAQSAVTAINAIIAVLKNAGLTA